MGVAPKLHGHFCGRCGFYENCDVKGAPCHDSEGNTVPEVTQPYGCEFCKGLDNTVAWILYKETSGVHFGDRDETTVKGRIVRKVLERAQPLRPVHEPRPDEVEVTA